MVVKADLPDVNPQDLTSAWRTTSTTIRGERKFEAKVR
jgi:hypothetical protein